MVDRIDLELRHDALEQRVIEYRAGELALHEAGQRRLERVDVQRDDGAIAAGRQPFDQAVADLAAGAGDEDNRFANHAEAPVTAGR
jgi:hypothetical protein